MRGHPAECPLISLQGIAPAGRFWLAVLIGAVRRGPQQYEILCFLRQAKPNWGPGLPTPVSACVQPLHHSLEVSLSCRAWPGRLMLYSMVDNVLQGCVGGNPSR